MRLEQQRIWKKVATEVDGDLFEITPKIPYTNEDLNYKNSNSRVI